MMLRQDLPLFEFRQASGVKVEIGISLGLLAVVIIHVTSGTAEFFHDTAIFMLILWSFYLRELGRAWAIRRLGYRLDRITLTGGGGGCAHSPASSYDEETIALMAPIVSLALWALSSLALLVVPDPSIANLWLRKFAFINLFFGLISLLPMQPLDGGRFLYLVLARTTSPMIARRVMGALGLPLAVLWLPLSLGFFLVFGLVSITIPSIREHWVMLRGAPVEGR